MPETSRQTLILTGVSALILALATGGYFTYQNIEAKQENNSREVERLGYTTYIRPGDADSAPSSEQLKARLAGKTPSPTQQRIYTLTQETEKLQQLNQELQTELSAAQVQIKSLETYRQANEYFAPDTLDQTIAQVEIDLKLYLRRLSEAERFSDFQIEIMALASAKEFRRFAQQHRLVLDKPEQDLIVNEHLPGYAFCVGDGVEVATNNSQEERMLAQFLSTNDTTVLSTALRHDLLSVIKPCQQALRETLDTLF